MGNTIGLKGRSSVVNRTLIVGSLSMIEPILDGTTPPSPLQVHLLKPITLKPPFPILTRLELLPPLGEFGPVRGWRKEVEEGGEGEVVVAGEEHVALVRVAGGKRDEEIEDLAGVWTPVAVIAEEDYGGGLEVGRVDGDFEVGPEVLELRDEAMDVADAAYDSGFWL